MALLSRYGRWLLPLALAATCAGAARAQESLRLVEHDIKAGLLYNFLRYTQWPAPAPNAPAIVCVYGRDAFEGRLQPMAGRTVNQRAIEIRAVRSLPELDSCSLLYVNAEERARWAVLRGYLANRAVLTVSDFPGFADNGGMIEFTRRDARIGVRINTGAVSAARLMVQDRLLRLASPGRATD
jgi:hypothetical protein